MASLKLFNFLQKADLTTKSWLTCVDLLQRDVFLQLPAQSDLRAILSVSAVVSQNEVGMAVVKHRKFAERVGHGLVRSRHLVKAKTQNTDTVVINRPKTSQKPNLKHSLMLIKHEYMHSCALQWHEWLTSRPIRSSLFSTIPHGAIPMAHTFPRDLEEWSFSASPTCRITPVQCDKKE